MSSQADALLQAATADDAELGTAVVGTMTLGYDAYNSYAEPHIVIGSDRFITVPDELKRLGVQYDHNVETVTFDCPRYWDEHDMSKMKIYINYIRADKEPGCYPIDTDITVDETDDSIMHFDWTISREVTAAKGNIVFLVCVKKTDDEGNESEHWNSELCKDAYISEGLETMETILNSYPDLITHLLIRMDDVEYKTTLESMLNYLDIYFTTDAKINEVLKNYVTEYLSSDSEITDTIRNFVNDYIANDLSTTDKTLTLDGGVADAKATGDAIKNQIATTTDSKITNSRKGGLRIRHIYGKSNQTTTTGAQLLDISARSNVSSNVTIDDDGWVKYSYTNITGTSAFRTTLLDIDLSDLLTENTDYLLVCEVKGLSNCVLYPISYATGEPGQFDDQWSINATGTHTRVISSKDSFSDSSRMLRVHAYVSGATISATFRLSLIKDTAITADTFLYEPFSNGKATPNPDYPQEITSVSSDFTIYSYGQNLFDANSLELGENTKMVVTSDGYSITVNGGSGSSYTYAHYSLDDVLVKYLRGKYIHLAIDRIVCSNNNVNAKVEIVITSSSTRYHEVDSTTLTTMFLVPTNTSKIAIRVYTNDTGTALSNDITVIANGIRITLEEDAPWSEYVRRISNVVTENGLTGLRIPEGTGPTVGDHAGTYIDYDKEEAWICDEIDADRSVYVQRLKLHDMGSLEWTVSEYNGKCIAYYTWGESSNFLIASNIFRYVGKVVGTHELIINEGDYTIMCVENDDIMYVFIVIPVTELPDSYTSTDVSAWLTEHNAKMLATLPEPVETALTEGEIIALSSLKTDNNVTYVLTDGDIEPTIEVDYGVTDAAAFSMDNYNDTSFLYAELASGLVSLAQSLNTLLDLYNSLEERITAIESSLQ